MIINQMHLPASAEQTALITAALLYDFGYLYVPQTVLDKGDDLTTADKDFHPAQQSAVMKHSARTVVIINSRYIRLILSADHF